MRKVLIVENDPLTRELALEDFAAAGFQSRGAENSDKALALLNGDRNWALLFTDIRMPGSIDGWQLGNMARLLMPKLRVSYASGSEQEMPELAPGERFLTKPYRFEDVKSALRSLRLR